MTTFKAEASVEGRGGGQCAIDPGAIQPGGPISDPGGDGCERPGGTIASISNSVSPGAVANKS